MFLKKHATNTFEKGSLSPAKKIIIISRTDHDSVLLSALKKCHDNSTITCNVKSKKKKNYVH
jgi:hypothetical protein